MHIPFASVFVSHCNASFWHYFYLLIVSVCKLEEIY